MQLNTLCATLLYLSMYTSTLVISLILDFTPSVLIDLGLIS